MASDTRESYVTQGSLQHLLLPTRSARWCEWVIGYAWLLASSSAVERRLRDCVSATHPDTACVYTSRRPRQIFMGTSKA